MTHPLLPARAANVARTITYDNGNVFANGQPLTREVLGGIRRKWRYDCLIIKVDDVQGPNEHKFWEVVAPEHSQYFVPIIPHPERNIVIQPFLDLIVANALDPTIRERWEPIILPIFDRYTGDYHNRNWGVTVNGLPAIFDYGFLHRDLRP